MDGRLLAGGKEAAVGGRGAEVANRKSLNCLQNCKLTSGNLADSPYEVSAGLSLDPSLTRFQCGSFLNPLRLIPWSRASQADSPNNE